MRRGVKCLWLVAGLSACASGSGELQIRANDPSAALRASSDTLALAKGQLALGNVGIALEGFRKAAREQPDNPEPLRGLAACYEAMGRKDLARANTEAALALAPDDPVLLKSVAGLEQKSPAG